MGPEQRQVFSLIRSFVRMWGGLEKGLFFFSFFFFPFFSFLVAAWSSDFLHESGSGCLLGAPLVRVEGDGLLCAFIIPDASSQTELADVVDLLPHEGPVAEVPMTSLRTIRTTGLHETGKVGSGSPRLF